MDEDQILKLRLIAAESLVLHAEQGVQYCENQLAHARSMAIEAAVLYNEALEACIGKGLM